jgi:hypothetical protein
MRTGQTIVNDTVRVMTGRARDINTWPEMPAMPPPGRGHPGGALLETFIGQNAGPVVAFVTEGIVIR